MRTRLVPIGIYLLMAFGLSWLVVLPLWQGGGLLNPLFLPLSVAMMFTPAISAAVTTKIFFPGDKMLNTFGLVSPVPLLEVLLWSALAIVLALAINVGALVIATMLGVFQPDLVHLSALREVISMKLAQLNKPWPANMPPMWVIAVAQIMVAAIAAPINALAALGEEIGWRGFLFPQLQPLGTLPAIILGGIIWGLWHAPLILLGYNYPTGSRWLALACMSGMCVALGAVLVWLRLKTSSIWPCAVFHGAINASAGFYAVFGTAGKTVDLHEATILGWTGWVLPVVLSIGIFWLARPLTSKNTERV